MGFQVAGLQNGGMDSGSWKRFGVFVACLLGKFLGYLWIGEGGIWVQGGECKM